MIFNVMERDYWLIASFLDADKCKEYAKTNKRSYWIGIWPDGSLETEHGTRAIPMWEVDDFVQNFPHAEISERERLSYSF